MVTKERISQTDLPRASLERALRLPRALIDQFAGEPATPLDLAMAVGVKPSSSGWRALTGAAIGYGLTEGGYNASTISLTALGRRVVSPQEEGEDIEALREACLKPRVIAGFLSRYDGNKFPREDIARNVLQGQFDVPAARAEEALSMIVENAETIGAFRTMGGDRYVSLAPLTPRVREPLQEVDVGVVDTPPEPYGTPSPTVAPASADTLATGRQVGTIFVGHSHGAKILEQVKQLLELADLGAEVAVEEEEAAIPVSDGVFDAMSRSDAAIICVTADQGRESVTGYEVPPNLLIEIGAAYVRHDKRLVLLWDRRVDVPFMLRGLYRCEFEGEELSWEAGMRLQQALIEIKKGLPPG